MCNIKGKDQTHRCPMMLNQIKTSLIAYSTSLIILTFLAPAAIAYETYSDGCDSCHGGFDSGNYTSNKDGTSWGKDLMAGHEDFITGGGRCDVCHSGNDKSPVNLSFSDDTERPQGCVGCHGRVEDESGICAFGLEDTDGEHCGSAAGLRNVHDAAGIGTCFGCHSNDIGATLVGEDILPFNYGLAGISITSPCTDEAQFGPTGLDNDGDGATDAADTDCTKPTADANGPYAGIVGTPVSFDGTGSSDPNGTIAAYDWDFGDGGTGTGATPEHTYSVDGVFTVTLTVTDNDAQTDMNSTSATIDPAGNNVVPIADAGPDQDIALGNVVNLDGTGSNDPDAQPQQLTYQWSFASVPATSNLIEIDIVNSTSASASFTPDVSGIYMLRIDVSDGADTDFDQVQITVARFADVPPDYWAFSFIETLARAGITAGCGGGNYCPLGLVTRAQMAVFLERGMNGSSFVPPAATGNVFVDIGAGDFAANFIEQLAADGITAGCGNNSYCPDAQVTRDQMAVFLLRAKHGAGYNPPAATGVFTDVPPGRFAAAWIEQLAAEGITAGCGGGNYCPDAPVNRDQMAVFLVRTFDL